MTSPTDTMAEGLQKMLSQISLLKTVPDADLAFLTDLETTILKKLREPVDAMAAQQQQAVATAGTQAVGSAPTPGGSMPMAGVMPTPTGNPDEIRRMLAGG